MINIQTCGTCVYTFIQFMKSVPVVITISLFSTATSDLSNLYLKMFKLVFGSVTLFAQENELMLKVYIFIYQAYCILVVCVLS